MCTKKIIMFLLFYPFLFIRDVSAQQEKLDNLLKSYKNYDKEDTNKLTLLFHIVNYYSDINPNTGLKYALEAINIAEKLPDKNYLARAYKSKGIIYKSKSDVLTALKCYQQALKIYQNTGNKKEVADCLRAIGFMFLDGASNAPIALSYFNSGLAIAKNLNDSFLIAKFMVNIGTLYGQEKNLPTALEYFHNAISIFKIRNDSEAVASTLSELGTAYDECNNFQDALAYYQKSLQAYTVINYNEERKKEDVGLELYNIGDTYRELGNNVMALHYLNEALKIYRSIGSNDYVAWCYGGLSDIHLETKRYEQAIIFANKSKNIAEKTGDIEDERNALENLSEAYANLKQYKTAYQYYTKYITIRDSIENTEKQKQITQLQMQDEFNRQKDSIKTEIKFKDLKVKQQQNLNRLQLKQQWFYSIGIVILLALATSWYVYDNRLKQQKLKLELAKEKAEQEKREAVFQRSISDISLAALRSQMNPHFIFNCLNSIKLYTTQNDTETASEYLTKFSRLIRLVMENSTKEKILLSSELDTLRLYIEMEAMRFKEKLRYNINVENNVETDYIELPPMLLQPYIENAIWHGLMPKEEGGKIDINIAMHAVKSLLEITIADNGIGREKSTELKSETTAKHTSYGMKVTSERIALINQVYKTDAEVTVNDLYNENGKVCGTKVIIQIPV